MALPLRGHVPDAVNCGEGELAAVLEVPRQVPVRGPWAPLLGDRPRLLLDPSASAQSRHRTIGIT